MHEDHAIGHRAGERHLVGRHEHRGALCLELAHQVKHLADELRIERGGDLVEQQQLRIREDRASDGHTLLLASREAVGKGVELRSQPKAIQERRRLGARGVGLHAVNLARREGDVVDHLHVREQVELLEDDADAGANGVRLDARVRDVVAAEQDAAVVDALDQVDDAHEGGLAGTRSADQRHDVVLVERQVNAAQHVVVAEEFVHALNLEDASGAAHTVPLFCSRFAIRAVTRSVNRITGNEIATKSSAATTYGVKL